MRRKPSSHLLLAFFAIFCLTHLQTSTFVEAMHGKPAKNDAASKGYEERIVGGTIPPEGKYPSLGRISKILPNGTLHTFCAGTILNRDWILSSARCFVWSHTKLRNISRLRFTVGDSKFNETEPYEQTVRIERFIMHAKFDAPKSFAHTQFLYDIAVAKVVPSIKFSNRVSAVNLPTCGEFELGTGWIAGWGRTTNVYTLTEVSNPIVTNEECDAWLKQLRPYFEITKLITCTRYPKLKGWCWGDYGTPLFIIKNESYMVQVGIASVRPYYSSYCGFEGDMTLYTRVSEYLGWIHRRISGCGNHPFHPITAMDDEEKSNQFVGLEEPHAGA